MRPAVFLDRDGTIIDDIGYIGRADDVRVLPTVPQALRMLGEHGFARVVVTNQSGVARGFFDEPAVLAVHDEIATRLAYHGVAVDAFYYCPHYGDDCACRKPEPGMIWRASAELALDLTRSAVVGDRGSDIELGHRLGLPAVLVPGPTPYTGPEPDYRATTLLAAAQWIVHRGA